MTARNRAADRWGVTPAVPTPTTAPPLPDASSRPAPDEPLPPSGVAWAECDRESATALRPALRLDEQQGWAEHISGGRVSYPHGVDRPATDAARLSAMQGRVPEGCEP